MSFSWPVLCLDVLLALGISLLAYALVRGRRFGLAPVVRAALVNNLEDLLVVFDLRQRVIDINRAAAGALGTTPKSALGRPAAELLAAWPQVVAQLSNPAGKHEVTVGDRYYELAFYPADDASGRRRATLLLLRDVTVRRRAENEVARSRDSAQSADEAKGRFLAMMSHEIRTPMNGLLGFTDLLAETDLTGEQREYLGYITESGKSLLVIINDVLDFSKIEAGELHLERIGVDLRVLLANTCAALIPRARAKRLTLQWKIDDQIPNLVFGDPVRLRQILNNLAGNALKFTDHGSVEVEIARIGGQEEASGCTLALIVRDTGIGIAPENVRRIFRPFSQADTSTTRRYGGTGLGLAITRRLCELMGGELEVSSVAEEGSVFTARVRVALTPGGDAGLMDHQIAPPTVIPAPRAILVFEDNPINERLITTVLKQAGHTVRAVPNGQSGLAVIDTGARFDVILMDLQMPGMDGYSVVQEIRRREAAGLPAHYIIALTAHALKGERQRCLDAGMNDYLAKPVDHSALWAALSLAPEPRHR